MCIILYLLEDVDRSRKLKKNSSDGSLCSSGTHLHLDVLSGFEAVQFKTKKISGAWKYERLWSEVSEKNCSMQAKISSPWKSCFKTCSSLQSEIKVPGGCRIHHANFLRRRSLKIWHPFWKTFVGHAWHLLHPPFYCWYKKQQRTRIPIKPTEVG